MPWLSWFPLLIVAILFEVAGVTCMKLSVGFTKMVPSVALFVCYGLSFLCLTLVLRKVDVSIAYALWSAIGTTLVAIIGALWFGEAMTAMKIASIALIVAGVIGLRLSGSGG